MCVCAGCLEHDPDGVGCTCDRWITCDMCRELDDFEELDPEGDDPELAGLDPEDDAAEWLREHEEDNAP